MDFFWGTVRNIVRAGRGEGGGVLIALAAMDFPNENLEAFFGDTFDPGLILIAAGDELKETEGEVIRKGAEIGFIVFNGD